MYAAIQDAYTSGSETYAQIQPVASTSAYTPSSSNQNPSTSAANVTQKFNEISIHSRQGMRLIIHSRSRTNELKNMRKCSIQYE